MMMYLFLQGPMGYIPRNTTRQNLHLAGQSHIGKWLYYIFQHRVAILIFQIPNL